MQPSAKLAPRRDVVVVGGSAGGVEALRALVAQLPSDLPATVLVVTHSSPVRPGRLASVLAQVAKVDVAMARTGDRLAPGRLFVATPGLHLLIRDGHLHLSRGPKENLVRPAIDALFRSAAVSLGSRVIGILLSGLLDDGTAGLSAIKRCGGIAIVQDPREAAFPDMPHSALRRVQVDHCLPVGEMGALLLQLTRERAPPFAGAPRDLRLEDEAVAGVQPGPWEEEAIGTQVPVVCPECGGPVWEIAGEPSGRYRCQVGHAFSARALVEGHASAAERALWGAVVYLEQQARVMEHLRQRERSHGRNRSARHYEKRVAEVRHHVEQLKSVLLDKGKRGAPDNGDDEQNQPGEVGSRLPKAG